MNSTYICDGKLFTNEIQAFNYAKNEYNRTGIILGIARVNENEKTRMDLIDEVINQIHLDLENGELSGIIDLLNLIPSNKLESFLTESEVI
jgi:hypothetical protein